MTLARKILAPAKFVARGVLYPFIFSDVRSVLEYSRVSRAKPGSGAVGRMAIRALGGNKVIIRAGADSRTIFSTFFHKYHLPPSKFAMGGAPVILDLGANIGLTMAHMASLYPRARIIGVELDRDNAAVARRNIEPWEARCALMEGAIWSSDGEILEYETGANREDGFTVAGTPAPAATVLSARSFTIDSILRLAGIEGPVDYVKMDIEGAEKEVLRSASHWSERVRCIKIELHSYSHEECISDLTKLGFSAYPDHQHNLCVVGERKI